jgi:hypothetical protein
LCLQIVLPDNLLQDVLRLPVLVTHFIHHNNSGEHIHFREFIAQHYLNHGHQNKDHDQHHDLPFHHGDLNLYQVCFTDALTISYPGDLTGFKIIESKKKIIEKQHFNSSIALFSVWRPPRLA